MRNRTIIGALIITLVLVATLLIFQSPVRAGKSTNETMESSCRKETDGKMIWENLSQQFFSSL
jgi:hypothetical protein